MIKIRSTEKLATSNNQGLCDLLRVLSNFNFDLEKRKITTIVQDFLFQEKPSTRIVTQEDANGDLVEVTVDIVERKIIETRQMKVYTFGFDDIDGVFGILGKSITKTKGFTNGIIQNLAAILNAQTVQAKRQGMTTWITDTEHEIVAEFTV